MISSSCKEFWVYSIERDEWRCVNGESGLRKGISNHSYQQGSDTSHNSYHPTHYHNKRKRVPSSTQNDDPTSEGGDTPSVTSPSSEQNQSANGDSHTTANHVNGNDSKAFNSSAARNGHRPLFGYNSIIAAFHSGPPPPSAGVAREAAEKGQCHGPEPRFAHQFVIDSKNEVPMCIYLTYTAIILTSLLRRCSIYLVEIHVELTLMYD